MDANHFADIDQAVVESAKRTTNWRIVSDWERVKRLCEQEIPRLGEQVEKLDKELKKLAEPPLQYAVYLSPSPDRRDAIVSVERRRYEVHIDNNAGFTLDELVPGQQVLLNQEMNIVARRDQRTSWGETAEVVNIIRSEHEAEVVAVVKEGGDDTPVRLQVKWQGGTRLDLVCSEELARLGVARGWTVRVSVEDNLATLARPRLHVKANGNDGMIVEISEHLAAQGVHIGDIVYLDMGAKFAFDKLPPYEVGKLTLEDVPDVTYDDIGGLDEQIEQIYDAIDLPYLHRDLFERFQLVRPKGILLHGPPGCGKTMIAKAVANSLERNIYAYLHDLKAHLELYLHLQQTNNPDAETWEQYTQLIPTGRVGDRAAALQAIERVLHTYEIDAYNARDKLNEINGVLQQSRGVRSFFLNVKGPELLDKYVGETEHRIRKVFEEARKHAGYYHPVVIFFDEMEAMFRTRGTGISSDVETTIVPQFLSEIDGVEGNEHIVIIGASNRQELIDPAILRPGRLDVKIKIGRPDRQAAQDILALHLPPTLPFDTTGLSRPAASRTTNPGEVVFRTAYAQPREDDPNQDGRRFAFTAEQRELLKLLPSGCDMRQARCLSSQELALLAHYPDLTFGTLLSQRPTTDLAWDKIRLFPPQASVGKTVQQLVQLDALCRNTAGAQTLAQAFMQQEWIAEALILSSISNLYSSASTLQAMTNENRYSFLLKEFVSGAILANIVARAKRQAIKTMLPGRQSTKKGISLSDLLEATRQEFDENAEHLLQQKLHDEFGRINEIVQDVRVNLKMVENDLWSEEKRPLYSKGIIPPADHRLTGTISLRISQS